MTNTIAITFDRQNKIDNLEQHAVDLKNSSANFQQNSTSLKRNMKCRNIKIYLMIGAVIAIAIAFLSLVIFI